MCTGVRVAAIFCIFFLGMAVGKKDEDITVSVQQQFRQVERAMHRAAARLKVPRQPRRLSPKRPPSGKPCTFANSKCNGNVAFADQLAAAGDANLMAMWTSEKLCMGMSSQAICDAAPTCSWTTSCHVSEATMSGMTATMMAPLLAGCGEFGAAMGVVMSCQIHDDAACTAASTCQTIAGQTASGGACVNKTDCESSRSWTQSMCGANHPADSFETCLSDNGGNYTAALPCVSQRCATEGDIYACAFTSDEAACGQNPKCQWSSDCGFNMATLYPDDCGLKALFSATCDEATTEAGCVGNCTWFSMDETCSDAGVYSQGSCALSSTAMFPDGDKSQMAFADIEYTLKSCQDKATEAACSGFAAPELLGDYPVALTVGSRTVGMRLGVASLLVVTLGVLYSA